MDKIYKLPFETEELVEFLSDESNADKVLDVSFKNSELSEENFLYYINNLNLKVRLLDFDVPFERKEQLLLHYFKIANHFKLSQLVSTLAAILYRYFGIQKEQESILTVEEIDQFITNNKEELEKIILFLDSVDLCFLTLDSKDARDIIKASLKPEDIIDDKHFVGLNVSWLFTLKGFADYYLVEREYNKKYFLYQFDQFIYSNGYLSDLLIHNNSELSFIYNLYGDINKISKDFIESIKEDEIDKVSE